MSATTRIGALALLVGLTMAAPSPAFWNPFEKLRGFIQKLDAMNQGATVKERWNNLVNASGASAPSAATSSSWGEAAPEARASAAPAAPGISREILIRPIRDLLARSVQALPAIEDHDERVLATASLMETWRMGLKIALEDRDPELLDTLWSEGSGLFQVARESAHEAAVLAASRVPGPLAQDLTRRAGRACKAARHAARQAP